MPLSSVEGYAEGYNKTKASHFAGLSLYLNYGGADYSASAITSKGTSALTSLWRLMMAV